MLRILGCEFAGVSRAVVVVYFELVTAFDYGVMPDDFYDGVGTVMGPAAPDEVQGDGLEFRPYRGCRRDGRLHSPAPAADLQRSHCTPLCTCLGLPSREDDPLADRVFCFYEMPKAPARGKAKAELKMPKAQVTLEAYS